ncbi:MAG TPA: energy-coupling factor transporter transmembrane component T [Spirochaetia bacterium]|nr:energy-coupling factor transporter transmembrane component T [Spirochaetia bacterium]
MTPDWLLRNEAYTPPSDSDAFLDRSVRSFLGVLSLIRSRTGYTRERRGLDARVKLVSTFVLILFTSLAQRPLFVGLCGTVLLVSLSLCAAEVIVEVLKACFAAGAFTAVILLPSAFWGNTAGVLVVTVKVLICVGVARLLPATTEWRALTRGLGSFRVPDIFVLVLDLTLRYIAILGALSLDMLYALRLRSVGRNHSKTRSLSGIAGTLFLKSRVVAEATYAAMECRCFSGTYRGGQPQALGVADAFVLSADAALIVVFALIGA